MQDCCVSYLFDGPHTISFAQFQKLCQNQRLYNTFKLGCNVTKETVYLVSLERDVVLIKDYNVRVNSGKFISTTEYLIL